MEEDGLVVVVGVVVGVVVVVVVVVGWCKPIIVSNPTFVELC